MAAQHLVGLAPRPIDLLPLLRIGALEGLWTCEAPDPAWAQAFPTVAVSIEAATEIRERWRGPGIDALLAAGDHPPLPAPAVLAAYTLTPAWRAAVARSPYLSLPGRTPARLPAPIAEKIAMRTWLARLGVPVPDSVIVFPGECDFAALARRLGPVMVVQDPHGSGGVGTMRVTGPDDLDAARRAHPRVHRWLASRWAGEVTVNLHGLVPARGPVAVSVPSLQLSGIAEIGAGFGEYGGSDFTAPPRLLTGPLLDQCTALVRRIGLGLSGMGHVGLFGVDIAFDGDRLAVIEINARVQASTWLLGEIELGAGTAPMLARHFLALNDLPAASAMEPPLPQGGSTLIIRHTGSAPVRAGSGLRPGVYGFGEATAWRRAGIGLLDCGRDEVVVGDLPRPGSLVAPGATLARLTASAPLALDSGHRLDPVAAAFVAAVQERIRPGSAPQPGAGLRV
ncbi:hypothetical protein AB0A73_21870 [Glycomyces sp. NPDC047369]